MGRGRGVKNKKKSQSHALLSLAQLSTSLLFFLKNEYPPNISLFQAKMSESFDLDDFLVMDPESYSTMVSIQDSCISKY